MPLGTLLARVVARTGRQSVDLGSAASSADPVPWGVVSLLAAVEPAPDAVGVVLQGFAWQLFEGHPVAMVAALIVGGAGVGYLAYRATYLVEGGLASVARSLLDSIAGVRSGPAGAPAETRSSPRSEVLYASLGFLNVGVLAGILFAVRTGRPRFFGMTVIGTLTVLLTDVLVFRPFDRFGATLGARTAPLWSLVGDRRFAASALVASVGVLSTVGRGLVFFALIAVFFVSMTLHVLLGEERAGVPSNVLLVAGGGGLAVAGQALTVPYYVRTLDTFYHTTLARHIATAGFVEVTAMTRYGDLPVFHTLAAVYIQLTQLDPRLIIGALMVFLFSVVAVGGFAFVRNVTGSAVVGFLGATLLAVNTEFIGWGTQSHVQSLSFVFLAVFLLLLTKWARDIRYTLTAAVVTLAWVMTHHLSVFMSVVLISTWVGAGVLWSLYAKPSSREALWRPLQQSALLVTAVGTYWWITGLLWVPIGWITEHSPAASSGLPTEQFIIQSYTDPVALAVASVPFVLNKLHYVFFLGLCAYGLWTIVRGETRLPSHTLPKVAVGFLVAAPLYVPNPVWIVARGMAVLNRWGIMTLLFLLPIGALGLKRVATAPKRSTRVVAVAVLVFGVAFLSLGAGFTDPSLSDSVGYDKGARKHFSAGNINSGEHISQYTSDTPVRSSHAFSGYLTFEQWAAGSADRSDRFGLATVTDGQLDSEPGLTVVEYGSLRTNRIKLGVTPERSDIYDGEVVVLAPVSDERVEFSPARRNIVYHNSDTMMLYEPPEPADSGDE